MFNASFLSRLMTEPFFIWHHKYKVIEFDKILMTLGDFYF